MKNCISTSKIKRVNYMKFDWGRKNQKGKGVFNQLHLSYCLNNIAIWGHWWCAHQKSHSRKKKTTLVSYTLLFCKSKSGVEAFFCFHNGKGTTLICWNPIIISTQDITQVRFLIDNIQIQDFVWRDQENESDYED